MQTKSKDINGKIVTSAILDNLINELRDYDVFLSVFRSDFYDGYLIGDLRNEDYLSIEFIKKTMDDFLDDHSNINFMFKRNGYLVFWIKA